MIDVEVEEQIKNAIQVPFVVNGVGVEKEHYMKVVAKLRIMVIQYKICTIILIAFVGS
jgi:hypothetical protein